LSDLLLSVLLSREGVEVEVEVEEEEEKREKKKKKKDPFVAFVLPSDALATSLLAPHLCWPREEELSPTQGFGNEKECAFRGGNGDGREREKKERMSDRSRSL